VSTSIDVFLKSDYDIENLLGALNNLLDINLSKVKLDEEKWYEHKHTNVLISFGNHSFINDNNMDFESYNYDIAIRTFGIKDPVKRVKICKEFARRVFDVLKETGKYDLMMVEGVQTKLDEFHVCGSNNRIVAE